MSQQHSNADLSPRPVRAAVFTVMVLIALASIWLIDRRAIIRMHEFEQQQQQQALP
jgi:hypothetical protein